MNSVDGTFGSPSAVGVSTQHPVFWLDDGSVIIEIEAVTFKVHRTLLTRHSPFLLSCTQSTLSVRIDPARGVSALDFLVLLESLYHDELLSLDTPFRRIASIVRVTAPNQLHFPRLHELALRYFVHQFPSGPIPFLHPPHLEEALALALEYNVKSIQKGLYYSLVTRSNFETGDDNALGAPGENLDLDSRPPSVSQPTAEKPPANGNIDPTVGLVPTTGSLATLPASVSAHRSILPPRDSQRCMRLMSHLIDHFSPLLFTAPAARHMACTDVFAGTWMPLVIQPAIEDDGVYKPLETLERLKHIDWAEAGLCGACILEKHAEWTEEQKVVWGAMDGWLGS
ncbi:hypothetical protein C8F01DRAFT_1120023 [Mycena amicta]|nr:hypothetical protein C8F01DRAFT_1120023 [Mycena amicta]